MQSLGTSAKPLSSRKRRPSKTSDSRRPAPCDQCSGAKKGLKTCVIKPEQHRFKCSPCLTPGKTALCSLAAKRLCFQATDFWFKHTLVECTHCKKACSDQDHGRCHLGSRRTYRDQDRVFGWCGQVSRHMRELDLDWEPYGRDEDYMLYYYNEKPYESGTPWSPLYVRKALSADGKR